MLVTGTQTKKTEQHFRPWTLRSFQRETAVLTSNTIRERDFGEITCTYIGPVIEKLHGMWDVSSLIRDRNWIPCSGVLTTGPPREAPTFFILNAATSQPWHCWYLASTHLAPPTTPAV